MRMKDKNKRMFNTDNIKISLLDLIVNHFDSFRIITFWDTKTAFPFNLISFYVLIVPLNIFDNFTD